MRKKSKKLAKLEKNRYSVFTDDLSTCYFCGKPRNDLHELLPGRNRINSMKYGYVLPVCRICHQQLESDAAMANVWKVRCQEHFCNTYDPDQWLQTFKRYY